MTAGGQMGNTVPEDGVRVSEQEGSVRAGEQAGGACGAEAPGCADAQVVDMLAEAREAQWTALSFMGEDAIKLVAPAKVNLFLGVGPRRDDGYHEVLNVMHALALHDNIYISCRDADGEAAGGEAAGAADGEGGSATAAAANAADGEGGPATAAAGNAAGGDALCACAFAGPAANLAVRIEMVDKTQMLAAPGARGAIDVPVRDNIVFKAIDLLARKLDVVRAQRIDVRIEKHVPMQAGLGGGSADAAAALVGMAHFWGLADGGRTLHAAASQLGADVAFFLKGGCGLFTGKGDAFERTIAPMKQALVLVRPNAGVSTAECYAAFDARPVEVPAELAAQAEDADRAEGVPLFNNLAPAAYSIMPELAEVAAWLAAECPGDPRVLLSGSGSATYAVVDTYAEAARIAGAANARGWWARATSFSSLRALKA